MRSDRNQLDIFDHSPQRLAAANRAAAEAARLAYNFSPTVMDERIQYYTAEAERYEAIAAASMRSARKGDAA